MSDKQLRNRISKHARLSARTHRAKEPQHPDLIYAWLTFRDRVPARHVDEFLVALNERLYGRMPQEAWMATLEDFGFVRSGTDLK